MKDAWHEQIQRHMSGQASAEEAAALEGALTRDAELRALYLDYMNLDATLGTLAAAGDARPGVPAPAARRSPVPWGWLAAAAAAAALVSVGVLTERHATAPRSDLGAAAASAQTSIARLHPAVPPAVPAWLSPTASLLQDPGYPH